MTAAATTISQNLVRVRAWGAIAVALNLAVTLPLAYVLNVWQDEAYTLASTGHGIAYAFTQSLSFEQNAPLYFVLIAALRHFGDSVFYLRMPSVLSIAAALWLVPHLARRYVPQIPAGPVALALALNPFAVWAAVEMRVYALVVLLSVLLSIAFFDAFLARPQSRAAAFAYGACVAVALYSQYYLCFLIAAQGLALLLYRRDALLRYVLACVPPALLFLPLARTLPSQVAGFKSPFVAPSLASSAATLAKIVVHYAVPLQFPHANAVYALLAVAILAAVVALRKSFVRGGDVTILVIAAAATALFALGTYVAGVHVLYRHAASLFVPSVVSLFALTTFLARPFRAKAVTVFLAVSMLASLVSLAFTYSSMAKLGDWERVTAYLRAHESAGQPIVVFEAENALPLAYYYRGPNRIVPIPQGVDFHAYDVSKFVVTGDAELQKAVPAKASLWLVTAGECRSDNVAFGCSKVERFFESRYTTVSDSRFFGSRVRLVEPKGNPSSPH